MLYRNIKNGRVIDIHSIMNDQMWEAVELPSSSDDVKSEKKVNRNGRKHKTDNG